MERVLLMRSLMFVPGHRQRMIERAFGLGESGPNELDVALLDLEDGVPAAAKAEARTLVQSALAAPRPSGPARFVRVNRVGTAAYADDIVAVKTAGIDGVVLPKVHAPAEVERAAGELPGVPLVPSIESAKGLLAAPAIAAVEGVVALLFGAEDFALDLGLSTRGEGEAAALAYPRSATVIAAAASGRLAIDGIWPDLRDRAGLKAEALAARRMGFAGKSCIHPDQIAPINEIFSPSDTELEHANRVVAAFDGASAQGLGAVALDGTLLDAPIVERARRTIRLHAAITQK
jgi:citrate lyase subunit beta / citryl-CoA lyase